MRQAPIITEFPNKPLDRDLQIILSTSVNVILKILRLPIHHLSSLLTVTYERLGRPRENASNLYRFTLCELQLTR